MKEMILKIPDESSEFVTVLLEKLGVDVSITKDKIKKEKQPAVSPTYLFGKWKDIDLDAKTLRKKSWDRSHKF